MSLLAALGIWKGSQALCGELRIINEKMYDSGVKAIERKYSVVPHQHPKLGAMITPANPRYVDYVTELIEYNNRCGKSTFTTIEKAKESREAWVERWNKGGGKFDNQGYALDIHWGRRMN